MARLKYKITFHSFWHTGSGLSSASDVDALVIKDKDKLPYLPGKTIKGLLKGAALDLLEIRNGNPTQSKFINEVFGYFDEKPKDKSQTHTKAEAFFTNAIISDKLRDKATKNGLSKYFFRKMAATAIDDDGIAREGSLRRIEVAIPCTLLGEIHLVKDGFENQITECMKMVRQLGVNRSRGLGRCTIELLKKEG